MRLLFLARHANYFRNFESVIRLWAERGHQVHLAVERGESVGGSALLDHLTASYAGVTTGEAPRREAGEWTSMAARLRRAIDLLRYLEPSYDGTPRLRTRAAERAPAFAVRFADSAWARVAAARALLGWLLRRAEAAIPPSRDVAAYLREQQADALLITPLIGVVGSSQPDYLRAARAAQLPTAVAVWSWDHLTSKALIRDAPDRVLVWNEVQRDEAVRLHGIAARPRGGDRRAVLRPLVRTAPQPHTRRVLRRRRPARRQTVPALRRLGALCRQPLGGRRSCSAGSPPFAPAPIRRCDPAASWCGRIRSGCANGTAWTCRRSATWRCGAATR